MKIAVASDHRGVTHRKLVAEAIRRLGHEVEDFGPATEDSVDYPDYAVPAARSVANGANDRAVLVCGTGLGVSMAANKVHGVRAALCHNEQTVTASRQHNDADVLCLGADVVPEDQVGKLVTLWLETPFSGEERHSRRVDKMMSAEQE